MSEVKAEATKKYVVKKGHKFGFMINKEQQHFVENQEVELTDEVAKKLADHIQTPAEHKKAWDAEQEAKNK